MPKRIQLLRAKGWRKPEGAIVVGRPSKWGNPFRIGMIVDRIAMTNRRGETHIFEVQVETRAQAVEFYRRWLNGTPFLLDGWRWPAPTTAQIRAELAWRDLACWCPPGPCHADVLLEIANQEATA